MFTNFSAAQINRLAQRLSETPLGRSASVANAAERFERLLAARTGTERALSAIKAILTAPGFEAAEGRLIAEIEADGLEVALEPATAAQVVPADPVVDPAAVDDAALTAEPGSGASTSPSAPRRRRDSDLDAKARQGELPPPPDFSAATHARFRGKLEGLVALAERGDVEGLRAVAINPVSSSPKALARYRDLCVMALTVRSVAKADR